MRFVLGFSALIVPTTLIGGTLPVMIKYFAQGLHRIGNVTAKLYSVNTFGAVIGTVLAGFFLIAWFGVNGTVYFAAFLNSAIGSAALYPVPQNALYVSAGMNVLKFPKGKP